MVKIIVKNINMVRFWIVFPNSGNIISCGLDVFGMKPERDDWKYREKVGG